MSTTYYENITYEPQTFTNNINIINLTNNNRPIKRETIYEKTKISKPIVVPANNINNINTFLDNNISNNIDYNTGYNYNNINDNTNYTFSEDQINDYSTINNNIIDNNNIINENYNQTTTELSSENNLVENFPNKTYNNYYYDEYMISKPNTNNNQIIPQKKLEFATITKITTNISNKKINQMPIEEDDVAKVIKLSGDENNNKKEEEIKIKKETIDNNITPIVSNPLIKKENNNYPGPAKITSIPNTNFKLNPRVRFAKEEKKINIVKLNNDNNNLVVENKVIEQKIENINDINNNKNEEQIIKKENIENKDNIIILNNSNENIKKDEEILEQKGPKDDLMSNIRKPDGKFHQVKILKKDKSNKLLNVDDIDININNINKEKPKPKVNVIILNNKKNKKPKKEEKKQIIIIKKTHPNNYIQKNNELNNNNNDRYQDDIIDNEQDIKDTDEIYDDIKLKKKDSYFKKIKNDDGLDEFDNNFNEHDKFYKKMINLFDD